DAEETTSSGRRVAEGRIDLESTAKTCVDCHDRGHRSRERADSESHVASTDPRRHDGHQRGETTPDCDRAGETPLPPGEEHHEEAGRWDGQQKERHDRAST